MFCSGASQQQKEITSQVGCMCVCLFSLTLTYYHTEKMSWCVINAIDELPTIRRRKESISEGRSLLTAVGTDVNTHTHTEQTTLSWSYNGGFCM